MAENMTGFECINCHKWVLTNVLIGTLNRNHCPYCLWSRHVDDKVAGDRKASCRGGMKPVGLTFKKAGIDKYGKPRQGELMLIHICTKCAKVSINRIAGDDSTELIIDLLTAKVSASEKKSIEKAGIKILDPSDGQQVKTQLFGKN